MNAYELTKAFVTMLTGSPDTVVDWRVINDKKTGDLAKSFRGTLDEHYNTLLEYNNMQWGVYVAINQLDGKGRELTNVSHIRAHVADLDDPLNSNANYQKAISSNFPPHFAVQSSENKYHLYWLVDPYTNNDFYTLHQRKIAQTYDADKTIIDATRVMRVPGFYHHKKDPQFVNCWQVANNPRYNHSLMQQNFAHVNIIEHVSERKELGSPDMAAPSLEWLISALNMLDPNELTYAEWTSITAAFKQAGWSLTDEQTLIHHWTEWCKLYSGDDYSTNAKLWNSLKDTEVGWKSFLRRTNVKAYMMYGANPTPAQEFNEDDLSSLPEILDGNACKLWFKSCYLIEQSGEIFNPSGRFMNSTKFNAKYGGKQFLLNTAGSKMTDEPWKAALRSTWWTIPKVDHVRFLPHKKPFEIIKDERGRDGLNTYLPVTPKAMKGDVSIFLQHVANILPNENDQNIFLSYLAHCVKFPGKKIPWAILLQSAEGVGKTAFFEIIRHTLGSMHVYRPKAPELISSGSKFNAWMRGRLAIVVDEIKIDERRELIEILKPMITDLEIEIQAKGADQDMEDNPANWIFFSNYKDAIPINKNGRRYCIFYSQIQNKQDLERLGMDDVYFDRLYEWLREENGFEYVADWLLSHPVDYKTFPKTAPDTSSKEEAVRIGRSPLEIVLDNQLDHDMYGFKHGFISVPVLLKAIKEAGIRTPTEYTLNSLLEAKGYYKIGFTPAMIPIEDSAKPSLIYSTSALAKPEHYHAYQLMV